MAESPDEVFERILAEEQGKGSSPAVAQARAKAARMRAQKGLPIDPAGAAKASASAESSPAAPAAEQPAGEQPATEEPSTQQPAAEQPAAEQPAAEQTASEQPAAEAAPERPAAEAQPSPSGDGAPAAAPQREPATVAAAAPAAAAASQAAPRGRGAAARAARAASSGEASPERLQRLLAVVKPEAIQRVEREPIDRVNAWPHLMAGEFLALLAITAFLVIFSAFIDAPFRELANINQTPNPSKAPWYFLGLQELLRYFHPQVAGVTIPQWLILGFFAAPYIDRNPSTKPEDRKVAIVLFTIFLIFNALLVIAGSLFRGPGFNWIYPWQIPVGTIFEL